MNRRHQCLAAHALRIRHGPWRRWADNGALLRQAASADSGVLLTADKNTAGKNMECQQYLSNVGIGISVHRALPNRVEHILALAPTVLSALTTIRFGQVVHLRA